MNISMKPLGVVHIVSKKWRRPCLPPPWSTTSSASTSIARAKAQTYMPVELMPVKCRTLGGSSTATTYVCCLYYFYNAPQR